jgi:putative ABC transport system permease protein
MTIPHAVREDSTMKTPLAWLNLMHQKSRTAIAVAGVAFAILLMFMQLGFYGATEATASVVYDELNFDLVILSPSYIDINRPGTIAQERLYQAMGTEGVTAVLPLYVAFGPWRNPDDIGAFARTAQNIMLLGLRPGDPVFLPGGKQVQADLARFRNELQKPGNVLIDRNSHKEFGSQATGVETEVGICRVRIAGQFSLGTGFGANGLLIVGDATFFQVLAGFPRDHVSLGLVQLKPGADPKKVGDQLTAVLPPDVSVHSRDQIIAKEKHQWVSNTSLGVIFFLGVLVAFFVGVVFVYQVIASDIRNRLHEFATLKALGYAPPFLSSVVLQQTLLVALFGYIAGLAVALVLYELARGSTGIPIYMSIGRAGAVLILAVVMCSLSGILSLRKVRAADPADLF